MQKKKAIRFAGEFFNKANFANNILNKFNKYTLDIQNIQRRVKKHIEVKTYWNKQVRNMLEKASLNLYQLENFTKNESLRLKKRIELMSDALKQDIVSCIVDHFMRQYIIKKWSKVSKIKRTKDTDTTLLPSKPL